MSESQAPMEVDTTEPVKDASLAEVLVNTRNAMKTALSTIARLRHDNESAIVKFQSLIASLREENANLRSGKGINDEVTKAIRAKIEMEMSEKHNALKLDLENTRKEVVVTKQSLLERTQKATDHGETIIRLQSQINELNATRGTMEVQIAQQNRKYEELEGNAAVEKSRVVEKCKVLESERNRLSAELDELKMKLHDVIQNHARAIQSSSNTLRNVRSELEQERLRGDEFAKEVGLCREEIEALQKSRDKERGDALVESRHLNEIIALHKEEVQDAEKETQRYKDLLRTIAVDKMEGYGKPDKKALDAHAELLLNDIQKSLEVKLNQIEAKRRLVDEAQDTDRRLLLSYEQKSRECEEAKRMNHELLTGKEVMENENLKLKRKVTRLEERILLAGGLMINNAPETPNRRFTTAPNSTRRLSLTPGVMKDEDTIDVDVVLADLMDIKQKNEKLMNTLSQHARRRSNSLGTPSNL